MRLPRKLQERWRDERGGYHLGTRSPPQVGDATSEGAALLASRTSLRIAQEGRLQTGAVIRSPEGAWFLSVKIGLGPISQMFRLIPVEKVVWERMVGGIHPVTKQPTATTKTVVGKVWACIEPNGNASEAMSIQKPVYRIITNAPVLVGDIIGGYTISKVQTMLGVHLAEAA